MQLPSLNTLCTAQGLNCRGCVLPRGSTAEIVYCPGAQLPRLKGDDGLVGALVVGKDRVVSGTKQGVVMEWAPPDPKAVVEDPKPKAAVTLSHTLCEGHGGQIACMQVRHGVFHWGVRKDHGCFLLFFPSAPNS
jgi:hypothetical protein